MKIDSDLIGYPYIQVVILFASIGSAVGGVIAELSLLLVFREADFAQIGYQPLLYIGLLGFIPALLTGIIVACKRIWRHDKKSKRAVFLTGFIISAFYMGFIILYLGVNSWIEIGVLIAFMIATGLFGAINAAIASALALPKSCKSRFDNRGKIEQDNSQRLSSFK